MTVKCPICGKETFFGRDNPFRPFCSERCKLTDLGRWAVENYRVQTTGRDEDEDNLPPHPPSEKHES